MENIIKDIDADGNGDISKEEWVEWIEAIDCYIQGISNSLTQKLNHTIDVLDQIFKLNVLMEIKTVSESGKKLKFNQEELIKKDTSNLMGKRNLEHEELYRIAQEKNLVENSNRSSILNNEELKRFMEKKTEELESKPIHSFIQHGIVNKLGIKIIPKINQTVDSTKREILDNLQKEEKEAFKIKIPCSSVKKDKQSKENGDKLFSSAKKTP